MPRPLRLRIEGEVTLEKFRKLTKDLPGETLMVPRFIDPANVNDDEPGVNLAGIGLVQEDGKTAIALGVNLQYFEEEEDEDAEN